METNTEFIVVHNKVTAEYANILQNHILKLKNVVPTLQNVNTVVWTEEQYRDNKPTLPSSAAIIFIGNTKFMKLERSGMEEVYEKFGMHILKAGDRYALFVDEEAFPREKIDALNKYAKQYVNDSVIAKESYLEKLKKGLRGIKMLFKKKVIDKTVPQKVGFVGPAAILPLVGFGFEGTMWFLLTEDAINKYSYKKALQKFRYTLLMTVVSIEQLPLFIGNDSRTTTPSA